MTDNIQNSEGAENQPIDVIEQLRRLYRGLEMSAGIMRDPGRTGGWSGANRTADAFARYAATAQSLHALMSAQAANATRHSLAREPATADVERETYRQMHDIATRDLGYASILEAFEATPHAMFDRALSPSSEHAIAEGERAKYDAMDIDQRAVAMADDSVGDPWELLAFFREKLRQSEANAESAKAATIGYAQRLAAISTPPVSKSELMPYDAGLLNNYGGGDVDWWHNYLRAELGRAHDFYVSQWEALP